MVDNGGIDTQHWWEDQLFRSVTLYPWATMDTEAELRRLAERGVNTVFVITKESDGRVFYDSDVAPNQVPNRDLLADLVDAARIHDLRLVPSLFTLCDKYLIETDPDVVQVAREGTEIRYPNVSMEWMHWVCPNHERVRSHLRAIVKELVAYDVDGVQLTHFEFQPIMNGESSYRSCFCDECLAHHESENLTSGSGDWIDQRCENVVSLLTDLAEPFAERDDLMVNLEVEAFADLDTALDDSREILGVDTRSVAEVADVLTPRTAHVDLDIHPLWIRDAVRSFRDAIRTPVVPSIRLSDGGDPETKVRDDELITAIQMALHGGARGVSLFSEGANIGRISASQWDTAAEMFEEMTYFEREYGLPD